MEYQGKRAKLSQLLHSIAPNVYFQPPSDSEMCYPCILYDRDTGDTQFADNAPYHFEFRYQIIVIDRDPDSEIPSKVAMLPKCVMDRAYPKDGLMHYVFNLYY